jgi:predicted acetyltransferase
MKMIFPTMEYKDKAIEYINEFYKYGSEINGSGSLDKFLKESTYEKWLESLKASLDIANIPDSEVPKITYFYVREDDEKIIGMVNIRLALNDYLREEGGHIGYSIRPTERRKHYATMMLNDALKVCDKLGIKEVLISCDKSNIASAGVIKNCGGVLKREFYSDTYKEELQMYQIK